MSERAGFVNDNVQLVGDTGLITQDWYRFFIDLYQYSGLAGATRSDGSGFSMWDDVVVPSLSMRVPSANAPDLATFTGGILMPSFNATTDKELHFCVQLPHGYVGGSSWHPFVHWAPSDATAGTVRWKLEYALAQVGGVFSGATVTLDGTTLATPAALSHGFVEGDAVSAGNLRYSGILAGRVYRDADDAADTYGADAFLLSAGMHVVRGTIGTHKGRTP